MEPLVTKSNTDLYPGVAPPDHRWIVSMLCVLSIMCTSTAALAQAAVQLETARLVNLLPQGQLYLATEAEPPASAQSSAAALNEWLARQQPVSEINRLGGSYWFHIPVRHDSNITQWVIEPHGGMIEKVDVRVYLPELPLQSATTGHYAVQPYELHYGRDVMLPKSITAQVLLRIESRYFSRPLKVYAGTQASYRQTVLTENILILLALGAMLSLAFYNLFVFAGTRDRALLYYALFLLAATVGWSRAFHIPAQWLGWYGLWWSFIPFCLLAVFRNLFYLEFLQLKQHAPRLARWSWLTVALALLALPSALIVLPYAYLVTSVVITMTLVLGLWAGILRLSQGYRPARYYLAAYVAVLAPSFMLLPSAFVTAPTLVRSAELLVVLGTVADAILLAFALAEKIRLMARQKDEYLERLNRALHQASNDHLTGIPNRYAFDRALNAVIATAPGADAAQRIMLAIIDLDGLKRINDTLGHASGDTLLREFSNQLKTLNSGGLSVYRLGGDEFAVIGETHHEPLIRQAMPRFEQALRETGFAECGISYGITFGVEGATYAQMLKNADTKMYLHKTAKRNQLDLSLMPAE